MRQSARVRTALYSTLAVIFLLAVLGWMDRRDCMPDAPAHAKVSR